MNSLDKLSQNIQKLVSKNNELTKNKFQLEEKMKRIEKDLKFFENRNQELPEVVLKNKKLLNEREKFAVRVNGILKRLEDIKV